VSKLDAGSWFALQEGGEDPDLEFYIVLSNGVCLLATR
jgi:hypothetical protein